MYLTFLLYHITIWNSRHKIKKFLSIYYKYLLFYCFNIKMRSYFTAINLFLFFPHSDIFDCKQCTERGQRANGEPLVEPVVHEIDVNECTLYLVVVALDGFPFTLINEQL